MTRSLTKALAKMEAGPYALAVLRFRISFPLNYPCVPPLVVFNSDVFHPLVTPSTISTYATSSSELDKLTTTDQERLPPGGLSLRHGFPTWFKQNDQSSIPPLGEESPKSSLDTAVGSECDSDEHPNVVLRQVSKKEYTVPDHVAGNGFRISVNHIVVPSINDVLHYMKQIFEDESVLDIILLDEACNEGAWHAWKAYRAHMNVISRTGNQKDGQVSLSQGRNGMKSLSDWNWEGVWAKRVKAIIDVSISDPALFAGGDDDDPVS